MWLSRKNSQKDLEKKEIWKNQASRILTRSSKIEWRKHLKSNFRTSNKGKYYNWWFRRFNSKRTDSTWSLSWWNQRKSYLWVRSYLSLVTLLFETSLRLGFKLLIPNTALSTTKRLSKRSTSNPRLLSLIHWQLPIISQQHTETNTDSTGLIPCVRTKRKRKNLKKRQEQV